MKTIGFPLLLGIALLTGCDNNGAPVATPIATPAATPVAAPAATPTHRRIDITTPGADIHMDREKGVRTKVDVDNK